MTDVAPRTTDTGLEEAETTRIEKFLAVVLGIFIFIGLIWAYAVPLDRTDNPDQLLDRRPAAVVLRDNAAGALQTANDQLQMARDEEATARETYRAKLDANQPADAEAKAYAAAQQATKTAQTSTSAAQAAYDRVRPAGDAAEAQAASDDRETRDAERRTTFLLRLGLVLMALAASFVLFDRLRRARSRGVVPAMGAVGASSVLAVVMAADYLDLRSVGPLALSLFGIAVTIATLVAYQRWLAARLPERRARKHECPWCGYPARSAERCEGCGRAVIGACSTCAQPRRAGVRHCGACGAT